MTFFHGRYRTAFFPSPNTEHYCCRGLDNVSILPLLICLLTRCDYSSELKALVESTNDEKSPFNRSSLYTTTDATVYPAVVKEEKEYDSKKRKLTDGACSSSTPPNSITNARFPERVLSNKHVNQVNSELLAIDKPFFIYFRTSCKVAYEKNAKN